MFYIYKIVGINYVGSTNNIKKRTNCHRSSCFNKNSRDYNYLVYHYIREKNLNIQLEILGVYKKECSDKIQKLVEQYYINKYNSVKNGLNTRNAFTNRKIYMKKYCEKNREKRNKQNKKYRKENKKINCPICNCSIRKNGLNRHQKTKKCKNSI